MITRQLEIRDFILSLARLHFGVPNTVIASLLERYTYNTILSVASIKTEIQKEILAVTKNVKHAEENLFLLYNITTPEEFLTFLKENRENGFINYQDSSFPILPVGELKSVNENNKIVTYEDPRIVTFLQDSYQRIPSYRKKECATISEVLDMGSNYLVQNHWRLQDSKETLKYMVGTPQDFLELEVAFFQGLGYPVQRYCFSSQRNSYENHLFLAYQKDGLWYYFEPFFTPFYGIHAFSSLKELESTVCAKFMLYYTTSSKKALRAVSSYTSEEKELYERALNLRDKAIYDYRIAENEDSSFASSFYQTCYEKWMESLSLFARLPRTYENYQLKKLKKVKPALSFSEYQSYLFYQRNCMDRKQVTYLYEKELSLYILASEGILCPGFVHPIDGVSIYQEMQIPTALRFLEKEKTEEEYFALLHQDLFSLVFHIGEQGRSVMKLDESGSFEQQKGIDLLNTNSACYHYPFLQMKQRYALQIKPDKKARFRGACSYVDLLAEKVLHEKLEQFQFLCPMKADLTEFSENFLEENKLPGKQERVEDYLRRTGIYAKLAPESIASLDESYPKGIWFGQMKRQVRNPFRVADLTVYLEKEAKTSLEMILGFSAQFCLENEMTLQSYILYFAKTLGKQLSILFGQNYYYQMKDSLDDITLSGEFCDDKMLSYHDTWQELLKKYTHDPMLEKEQKKLRFSYFFSFLAVTKSLQMMLSAFHIVSGKDLRQPLMQVFLGRFLGGLTSEKLEEFISFFHTIEEDHSFASFTTLFPEKTAFFKENKGLFSDMFAIIEEFIQEPDALLERVNRIMEEQAMVDQLQAMTAEEQLHYCLKKRFEMKLPDVKDLTLDAICDDSKVGLFLRKDTFLFQILSSLVTYQVETFTEFCTLGQELIRVKTMDPSVEKEVLQKKIDSYSKKPLPENILVVEMPKLVDSTPLESSLTTQNSSGIATPLYLLLSFLGMSCLILGIVLSFLL